MLCIVFYQHSSCYPSDVGGILQFAVVPSIVSVQPGAITAYDQLLGNPYLMLRLLIRLRACPPVFHTASDATVGLPLFQMIVSSQ